MDKAKLMTALRKSTNHFIKQSESEVGVGQKFIKDYRTRVQDLLGNDSFNYLEKNLDAKNGTWRVSGSFCWKNLKEESTSRLKAVKTLDEVVGPCPICKRKEHWYNDVPLRAFCWGTDKKEHSEWSKLVPPPYNPYIPRDLKSK